METREHMVLQATKRVRYKMDGAPVGSELRIDGIKVKVVKQDCGCMGCAFLESSKQCSLTDGKVKCSDMLRTDGNNVIFQRI